MNPKTSLSIALPALLAAALLLPSATAAGPSDALPLTLPHGLLRLDVSVVDGVATSTLSGAALDAEVACLDDTTGTVANEVLCLVDLAANAITCYEVGVSLDVSSGYVGLTSACKSLSAGCSTGPGHCEASASGRSPGPWTCKVSGSGTFSGSCYVVYSENNEGA
jgi:hypothetical protein